MTKTGTVRALWGPRGLVWERGVSTSLTQPGSKGRGHTGSDQMEKLEVAKEENEHVQGPLVTEQSNKHYVTFVSWRPHFICRFAHMTKSFCYFRDNSNNKMVMIKPKKDHHFIIEGGN